MTHIVFISYLLGSIQICLAGFRIVMDQSLMLRAIDTSYCMIVTLQLLMYSYCGELIIENSSVVADEFYQLDRDYLIIIARAQKTAIIRSGFYTADLPTFTAILSSAGSLLTLLKSFIV